MAADRAISNAVSAHTSCGDNFAFGFYGYFSYAYFGRRASLFGDSEA